MTAADIVTLALHQEDDDAKLRQVIRDIAALVATLPPTQQRKLGILCSMVGLVTLVTCSISNQAAAKSE